MAGGGKVRIADKDDTGHLASVVDHRLLVDTGGGGGGGGGDVNIIQVAGSPVTVNGAGRMEVAIVDGGGSISIDDGGGSLTVDVPGTVDVCVNDGACNPITSEPIAANRGLHVVVLDRVGNNVVTGESGLSPGVGLGSFYRSESSWPAGFASGQDRQARMNLEGELLSRVRISSDDMAVYAHVRCDGDEKPNGGDGPVCGLFPMGFVAGDQALLDGTAFHLGLTASGRLKVDAKISSTPGDVVTTDHFSGSTNGQPIQITGTTSGTAVTIHVASSTQVDRLHIFLSNTSASPATVTIEFGGTGAGNEIDVVVPPNDTVLAVGGAVIGGAASQNVRAYASTANVVNAFGRRERLS